MTKTLTVDDLDLDEDFFELEARLARLAAIQPHEKLALHARKWALMKLNGWKVAKAYERASNEWLGDRRGTHQMFLFPKAGGLETMSWPEAFVVADEMLRRDPDLRQRFTGATA